MFPVATAHLYTVEVDEVLALFKVSLEIEARILDSLK